MASLTPIIEGGRKAPPDAGEDCFDVEAGQALVFDIDAVVGRRAPHARRASSR